MSLPEGYAEAEKNSPHLMIIIFFLLFFLCFAISFVHPRLHIISAKPRKVARGGGGKGRGNNKMMKSHPHGDGILIHQH